MEEKYSSKRLQSDYLDLKKKPITGVAAEPLEKNIYTWHANILGSKGTDFEGGVFHVIFKFPKNYPISPPSAKLTTTIPHSHVYGSWICLDMLETHDTNDRYSGWSSAYTVQSILLQLQSFLFDDEDAFEKTPIYSKSKTSETLSHVCMGCPHNMKLNRPFPSIYFPKNNFSSFQVSDVNELENLTNNFSLETKNKQKIEKKERDKKLQIISDDLIIHGILPFLTNVDLKNFKSSSNHMNELSLISASFHTYSSFKPICFHTKLSYEETTLGVGINLQMNPFSKKIAYVSSPLDLISYNAFKEQNIRKSVWKEPFTHFLPIYINGNHANIDLFKKCICEFYNNKNFYPMDGVEILIKLLNTQVVNIMSGKVHNSIKALEGYFYFHRWLIWLVSEYPSLQDLIDEKIEKFIDNESDRNKENVPIIGEFIALLSISSKNWFDVANSLLREILTRNVLWALKIHPELHFDLDAKLRLKLFFETSKTMLKLISFHFNFLKLVRPQGIKLTDLADDYDSKLGQPSFLLQEDFQKSVFRVQKISGYQQFFNEIEIDFDEKNFNQILKWSIKRSIHMKYHNSYGKHDVINSIDDIVKYNPYKPKFISKQYKKKPGNSWSPWNNNMNFSISKLEKSIPSIKKDQKGNFIQVLKMPKMSIKKFQNSTKEIVSVDKNSKVSKK